MVHGPPVECSNTILAYMAMNCSLVWQCMVAYDSACTSGAWKGMAQHGETFEASGWSPSTVHGTDGTLEPRRFPIHHFNVCHPLPLLHTSSRVNQERNVA